MPRPITGAVPSSDVCPRRPTATDAGRGAVELLAGGRFAMNHSRTRTSPWIVLAVLTCLLLPPAAAAEVMIPVTVRITELWQLDHDQDPGVFGIGQSVADFYAEVTINGTKLDNFDQRCDNPPATPPANEVFDVPLPFFRENDPFVDPSCPNVPDAWTFTVDVPLSSLVGLSKTV